MGWCRSSNNDSWEEYFNANGFCFNVVMTIPYSPSLLDAYLKTRALCVTATVATCSLFCSPSDTKYKTTTSLCANTTVTSVFLFSSSLDAYSNVQQHLSCYRSSRKLLIVLQFLSCKSQCTAITWHCSSHHLLVVLHLLGCIM